MSARRRLAARLPLLLAASCAALAAIVLSEALQPQADSASTPSASVGKPTVLPPLPPDPEFTMPPEASFAVVVDRPLFSPSRRAIQGTAAVAAPGTSGDLKLVGVIIRDDERIALVKLRNGDQLESVRQGDNLAGWLAVSIAPDRVLFRHGAVEEELILELNALGFCVAAGGLGENITTRHVHLAGLGAGTVLELGSRARIQITGLRLPCVKIERLQADLRAL